jgi:Lactate racemase N-terminal domain
MPVPLPRVQLLRQTKPQPKVADVYAEARAVWKNSSLAQRIKPGMSIAVGCGSRGIKNHGVLAKATVDALLELGAKPFVVAAMGSHGGATPDGQRSLLSHMDIDEQHLGVPVKTEMDAVQVGTNSWGEPVWWDKNALAADGVVTVSRIKPHTDFRGQFESGLLKMIVIGLGKRHGADQHHRYGVRGLRDMMPETAKVLLEKTRFLGGLAILENAHEQTARLEVVDRDDLLNREPELLKEAFGLLGRLPFEQIDCLVVGECGKNYSGAGIDPNVVGRLLIEAHPHLETNRPSITRMCVLDISPDSDGNGTGIGIADLTTTKALKSIWARPFEMNNLTARFLWRSKLPFGFSTDRACIESGVETCWQPNYDKVRFCIIPNTLEVTDLWVSAPLAEEAKALPEVELVGDPRELPFNQYGELDQASLFPHCVRALRG